MIVPKKWIRNPSDELAIDLGCTFDLARGKRVCAFLESFCRQSKGEWAGKTLALIDWQRDFIHRLYGWVGTDGGRRFRTFYVEVPKKNGKSTLLSGLLLNHLVADDEAGAECYVCAYDRSQSSIIFDEARKMVQASPQLSRILKPVPSSKRIIYGESNGTAAALSADVPSKDGINASFTIFDELHRQRTSALWDIMRYAGASRRNPLLGSITTAGHDRKSICYQQRDYSLKVNAGLLPDITHLGVIYGADPDDDIENPATWRKANPSFGVTLNEADFAREVREAIERPTQLDNFLRLRLNIWTQSENRFLRRDKWEIGNASVDATSLEGRPCFAGLDLSTTTDLTALALIFPDDEGGSDVLMRFWAPREGAERRSRIDRVPYLTWANQGFLTLTDGEVIDYEFIAQEIRDLAGIYDLRKLLVDPWNAYQLCLKLQEEGFPVATLRQGFTSLSGPTKELERLVIGGKVRHGGHPILAWCADNAVAERDAAGNVKLSKRKSSERIDGLAALVNAVAGMTADTGDQVSPYESEGIFTL